MQDLHIRVGREVSAENSALLTSFLGGVEGVAAVQVERDNIRIRFDDRMLPHEQLLAMARSSVELLGYHLTYA
jgi:hypothetical protein